MPTLSERALALASSVARKAGRMLLKNQRGPRSVSFKKGAGNLVTDMDRASEETILRAIRRAFPDHAVVAEESGARGEAECRWFIDPLDGTTNYAAGFPIYAVSIAFEVRGRLEAGVVYHPALDDLYWAVRGGGAWRNRDRLRASKCRALADAVLCTGFAYEMKPKLENLRYFGEFLRLSRAVRRVGSASLDLSWTAAGVYDGFWEFRLGPWDIAAALLLCREAGAAATDFSGGPVDLFVGEVAAGGAAIQRRLVEILRRLRSGHK